MVTGIILCRVIWRLLMKKTLIVLLIVLSCVLFFVLSPAVVAKDDNEAVEDIKSAEREIQNEKKNMILVKYKDAAPKVKARIFGVEEQVPMLGNIEAIKVKEGMDIKQLAKKLRKEKFVESVELNDRYYLNGEIGKSKEYSASEPTVNKSVTWSITSPFIGLVNDPFYDKQWWLQSVKAPLVWSHIRSSGPVVVGVIDTGIDLSHEDLRNKIAPGGYNFIFDNYDLYDLHGHGTAVSGVVAAEANNGRGITGVTGPVNIKILPLQAGSFDGTMYRSDIIRAVEYAIDQDVDVINLSVGNDKYSAIEDAAIQKAIAKGITVVAAAGNDGDGSYNYPASFQNVISVGSISRTGIISGFSNYNDQVDFVAPGEYIYTSKPNNSYDYASGTSFSTPIVSGIVCLMKAVDPSMTRQEIIRILAEESLDKGEPGKDSYYGHGLVNAQDSLNKLIFAGETDYVELGEKVGIARNKGWKIAFNQRLKPETVSDREIYIRDSNRNILPTTREMDQEGRTVFLKLLEDYQYGQEYYLYIEAGIESKKGGRLKKPLRMKFSILSELGHRSEEDPGQVYEALSF